MCKTRDHVRCEFLGRPDFDTGILENQLYNGDPTFHFHTLGEEKGKALVSQERKVKVRFPSLFSFR